MIFRNGKSSDIQGIRRLAQREREIERTSQIGSSCIVAREMPKWKPILSLQIIKAGWTQRKP